MVQVPRKTEMLLEKANNLPLCPGVYIMKDKGGNIIYVGKSRKLKNRVSQYFQQSKKSTKTIQMVSRVDDFEYIICKTEIEALTLENSLIKQHSPKYNIKLKDAKSYPYIKITAGEYPRVIFTRTRNADKGKYFGPFSGTSTAYSILDIIYKSLGIPSCKRSFPRDIGKDRPCIYYQMGKCCGVCTGNVSREEYSEIIKCAADILRGHTRASVSMLEKKMMEHAEKEQFEAAARCRDTVRALKQLGQKQNVVADPDTNADVFGLYTDGSFACISTMYIRDGAVSNKNDFTLSADALTESNTLSAFLVEHYMMCNYIPRLIVLSFELDSDDKIDLENFLSKRLGAKVVIRYPERGQMSELSKICVTNAEEKVKQNRIAAQKDDEVLYTLAKMLRLESIPERIEAYDISNIGAEHITAGMVVFKNGKPSKDDYRSFNIRSIVGKPDDYSSIREAICRRLEHLSDANGSFSEYPDLLLIDGGKGQVSAARSALKNAEIDIPVFGMVKDDFHKTRALCTESEEINIAKEQSVFILIYKIQEEVHRFTVGRTTNAKRKTLKHSSLEKINGIGPAKAKKILSAMGTLSAVRNASIEELNTISGITNTDAYNIYNYYHSDKTTEN